MLVADLLTPGADNVLAGSPQDRCTFGIWCEEAGNVSFTIGYANNRGRDLSFAGLLRNFVWVGGTELLLRWSV